jgi:glyoxylase-like metal-dependent hydrolase (beta-lactamase superfamily II)
VQLIAEDVWQLHRLRRPLINAYLVRDVLIDAGTRWGMSWLLSDLKHRPLSMVALTHCHPDHQGCASLLCQQRGIPLACHEADVPAMEGRTPMEPRNWILRLGERFWSGPPCRVGRVLHEGDEVAGFRVIHAPGHTPGHVIYFRDSDRLVIAGDLLANINFLTWRTELREPPWIFSSDPAENRRSVRRLAELKPRLVCFGHGPPLSNPDLIERLLARWER